MRASSFSAWALAPILVASATGLGACNAITGVSDLVFIQDGSAGPGGEAGQGGAPASGHGGSVASSSTGDNTFADAGGVTITQISITQGIRIPLMENGQPASSAVPIVAGRAALMRVGLALDGNYDGKPVVARLWINGISEPITVTAPPSGSPSEGDLESTLNLQIPGSSIAPGLAYRLEIVQPIFDSKGPNPAAHYPAEGYAPTTAMSVGQALKIVLVPVRYGADGSNRLPDTSAQFVEGYKNLFYAMYPVPQIDLSVRDPVQWDQAVNANGYGWGELLGYVGEVRQQDATPADVYYYGIFAPAQTVTEYCASGCVAGLGNLAQPGDPYSRAAIGLGMSDDGGATAWETAVHEIGHTHGRQHSPCGGAQGTDPNYPYSGAKIGVWGYNLLTQQLYDPNAYTDVMGYCLPIWISDFTYLGILNRMKAVNQANVFVPPELRDRVYDRAFIDPDGELRWLSSIRMATPPQGEPALLDIEALGEAHAIEGHYFPYDHLPGGVFVWPEAGGPTTRVKLSWEGAEKTLIAP